MAVTEVRYGQPQTCRYDMQALLVKEGKVIGDITRATFNLKRRPGLPDELANYNKNSVDHPSQVSFAMEDVEVDGGGTESHLIVSAIVNTADFGTTGMLVRPDVTYYEGCSLMFSGDTVTTYELDTYPTDNQVKFLQDRVE